MESEFGLEVRPHWKYSADETILLSYGFGELSYGPTSEQNNAAALLKGISPAEKQEFF